MTEPVIRLDHVSKEFALKKNQARSFQELLVDTIHGRVDGKSEIFLALDDVSLEIERGETVGLIGPNGAGKSTLLKLISRIVDPTSGSVEINGRVRALLELGSGFHPDLTGRENIYLNGSIMGLKRAEINAKVDAIIAFAELERFIDVPVRHYSSGMYMRLGFSVAVHTNPEILLVDEVLAVGDVSFQRKCLERIDDLRREGITILFVSHSAGMVKQLCSRAIWIDEGRVIMDDSAEAVVARYLDRSWQEDEGTLEVKEEEEEATQRWGSGKVQIVAVRLLDAQGEERQNFHTGESLTVELHYQAAARVARPVFGLAIHRGDGLLITGPNTQFAGYEIPAVEGEGVVRYMVSELPLLEGTYYISVSSHNWEDTEMYDYHDRLYAFRVLPSEPEQYGLLTLQGNWEK